MISTMPPTKNLLSNEKVIEMMKGHVEEVNQDLARGHYHVGVPNTPVFNFA